MAALGQRCQEHLATRGKRVGTICLRKLITVLVLITVHPHALRRGVLLRYGMIRQASCTRETISMGCGDVRLWLTANVGGQIICDFCGCICGSNIMHIHIKACRTQLPGSLFGVL